MEIDILHQDHPERGEVIDYIHRKYAQVYKADIKTFMPHFIRLRNSKGGYRTVMGYRDAGQYPLFLEQYLDVPVEAAIAGKVGDSVDRNLIVEIGNMVENEPGDARWAIISATAFLRQAGFRWVVFTGVGRMRNAFRRFGLEPIELAKADPTRLSAEEHARWGSYYENGPTVFFSDIRTGYKNLQELWLMLSNTWAGAVEQGKRMRNEKESGQ